MSVRDESHRDAARGAVWLSRGGLVPRQLLLHFLFCRVLGVLGGGVRWVLAAWGCWPAWGSCPWSVGAEGRRAGGHERDRVPLEQPLWFKPKPDFEVLLNCLWSRRALSNPPLLMQSFSADRGARLPRLMPWTGGGRSVGSAVSGCSRWVSFVPGWGRAAPRAGGGPWGWADRQRVNKPAPERLVSAEAEELRFHPPAGTAGLSLSSRQPRIDRSFDFRLQHPPDTVP